MRTWWTAMGAPHFVAASEGFLAEQIPAMPDLPEPAIDRAAIERLTEEARADYRRLDAEREEVTA